MAKRWLAMLGLGLALGPGLEGGAAPTPALPQIERWEHGAAQLQIARTRMLVQRLGKQNLLYQLRLAGVDKDELVATAREVDAALAVLRDGSATLGVAPPPGMEARDAVESVDRAWGPLRRLALATPVEYARAAGSFSAKGRADPLLVRHVEELIETLDGRAAAAAQEYVEVCERSGITDCQATANAVLPGILSERLVTEAVLVTVGFDEQANREKLRKTREQLGQVLALAESIEQVQSAMSPERGKIGVVVGDLWTEIGVNWEALRRDVDRVLAGDTEGLDLQQTVATQQLLLGNVQRFSLAVQRFAAVRRAMGMAPE